MTNANSTPKLTWLTAAILFAVSCHVPASSGVADALIGELAPDFAGIDSNGKTHKLHELRGKTVVLEWTNHECPFVGKHYATGNMQALQKEATGKGIVWLSVISSAPGRQGYVEPAEANKLTASRDAAPTGVILDSKGEIGHSYGAKTTPHMYVINTKGELVYMGAIDDKPSANHGDVKIAKNYVRAALDALAAGKPIGTRVTGAYGCSVKYGY